VEVSFEGVPVRSPYHFESQSVGYGRVANQVYHAMKRAGINVEINRDSSPVRVQIDDPSFLVRVPGKYNIAFTTHESSELTPEWKQRVEQMDEVWTMSDWIAECFNQYTEKPCLVVPTCISDVFSPVRREKSDPFVFLHTGEPTARKNGRMVFEAFVQEFGKHEDAKLVFKSYGNTSIPGLNLHDNIVVLGQDLSNEKYRDLLYRSHCLVYPSTACGGGMMPLEAMATGMPVISTWEWADYRDYISLRLESQLVETPDYIKETAPQLLGQVFLTSVESISQQMRLVYEDYSHYEQLYWQQSQNIVQEYNWDRVVQERIVPRLRELEGQL